MTQTEEHKFETLETPERCIKCGRATTVMFTGRVCSRCSGVWTPEERALMEETRRNPYKQVARKVGGKNREQMFAADRSPNWKTPTIRSISSALFHTSETR